MKKIIKNGLVVTEEGPEFLDILIEKGSIKELSPAIEARAGDEVIDATNRIVFPGGVDPHTHLSMPFNGTVTDDDWETGTKAAAFGGTTSILDFCLTSTEDSMEQALKQWHDNAKNAYIDYGFHLNVTHVEKEDLPKIKYLCDKEGINSIKLFMSYVGELATDDRDIYRIFQLAKEEDYLVMVHCENGVVIDELIQEALAAGHTEPKYHYLTRPDGLEEEATNKVVELSKIVGNKLYVVHVTCEKAIEAIKRGRVGATNQIYAETCPQYLTLDNSYLDKPDFEGAKYVWSPPLRTPKDIASLWDNVMDKTINAIGSDQCSFNFHGKKRLGIDNFAKIPNGGPFIEDRFSLIYNGFVVDRKGSLSDFVDIIATNSAKIFGLYPQKGVIRVGSDADLVLFDPNPIRKISAKEHHMNVDYNPFEGMSVKGQIESVILRGDYLIKDGEFVVEQADGKYLRR